MKSTIQDWLEAVQLKWFFLGMFIYSVILGAMLYGFILPNRLLYDQNLDNQGEINDMYVNLISLDIGAAIASINQQINDLEELDQQFQERLVGTGTFNSLIPMIDKYSAKSNLKVKVLSPIDNTESIAPRYLKRFIKASMTGTFRDFLLFTQKLESYSKWLLIEKLIINSSKGDAQNQYDLVISVIQKKTMYDQ